MRKIDKGVAIRAAGIIVCSGMVALATVAPLPNAVVIWAQTADPFTTVADGAVTAPNDPTAIPAGLGLLEAVELTLAHDPNIAIVEARLDAARGALRSARGRFDPVLTSSVTQSDQRTPLDAASASESSTLSQRVALEQELRSGLMLEPSVDLERVDGAGPANNLATVAFTLRQPLLRDRGRAVVTAEERAREREVEAGALDLRHTVALRLLAMASQYWNARAALLDLEVLRATETSSRELFETTRRLVAADVTPAAEIVQLEADLTSREANRIAGERTLFQARQDLGLEIGLAPEEVLALPLPDDPFPTVEPAILSDASDAELVAAALAARDDLAAARARLAAAEIRQRAADNALEPRLDLVLTPSYSGLTSGGGAGELYAPLFDNVPGLSTALGFSFSWPTLNRQAEGALLQAQAATLDGALQVELLTKSVGARVPAALDAVRQGALQLARLDRAVALFEKTLENEIKKLRAGSSTVVDVITQRDRLTSAQQRRVAAQLALALALVDLRFQTGSLFGPRAVRYEDLTTLPF